ncbi:MAG: hypothetical protein L0Y72_04210, partial [Gemmataceae bacterium]|nr:hypothetical protein [Gemmataceae bacterium]
MKLDPLWRWFHPQHLVDSLMAFTESARSRLRELFGWPRASKPHRPSRNKPMFPRFYPSVEAFEKRQVPAVVSLSASTYQVDEFTASILITASIDTIPFPFGASVAYATSNGTATGGDYTGASGTFQWFPGNPLNKTFSILIVSDTVIEGNETVNITLSNPSNCTLGTSSAVLTIIDDDIYTLTEYEIPTDNSQPTNVAYHDGLVRFTQYGANQVASISTGGTVTEYEVDTTVGTQPFDITAGPWFTAQALDYAAIGNLDETSYWVPGFEIAGLDTYLTSDGTNLWIAEDDLNKIFKMTVAGDFTGYTVPTANADLHDITVGPDGALWFTEYAANKIGRMTTGGSFTEWTVPTSNSGPHRITVGPDGNIWFTEKLGGKIGRISLDGKIKDWTATGGSGALEGITAGPDGNIWFVTDGNKIGRFTISDKSFSFWDLGIDKGPTDLTVGEDGNLWITATDSNTILKFAFLFGGHPRIPDPGDGVTLPIPGTPPGPPIGGPPPMPPGAQVSIGLNTGNLKIEHEFDVGQSPDFDMIHECGCGSMIDETGGVFDLALVHDTATTDVKPIIEVHLFTDEDAPSTSQVKGRLKWDGGSFQSWVTFTGISAGEKAALGFQVSSAVTATDYYPWLVELEITFTDGNIVRRTISGYTPVIVNGS